MEERFAYASTAEYLTDPRGIYSEEDDNNTDPTLYQLRVGQGTDGGNAMRYLEPAMFEAEGVLCHNVTFGANYRKMWFEADIRFNTGFTTANPGEENPSQKLFQARGPSILFAVGEGEGENGLAVFNLEDGDESDSSMDLFDNAYHNHKVLVDLDGGRVIWAIDGVIKVNYTGDLSSHSDIGGWKLGLNLNRGTTDAQSYDWGLVRWFIDNPGWAGFPA